MSNQTTDADLRARAHALVWDKHPGNGVALCPRVGKTAYEHTPICDAVFAALASGEAALAEAVAQLHDNDECVAVLAERDALRANLEAVRAAATARAGVLREALRDVLTDEDGSLPMSRYAEIEALANEPADATRVGESETKETT